MLCGEYREGAVMTEAPTPNTPLPQRRAGVESHPVARFRVTVETAQALGA
jgi:hypothetical protein